MALQRVNWDGYAKTWKRRKKNIRRQRRAERWTIYVRPMLDVAGRVFGRR